MPIQKLAPLAAAIALLAGAATASAHVEVNAAGGDAGEIIVSVPNESSTAETISVAVQLPRNVVRVSVPTIAGWTHTEQTVPLDPPLRVGGVDLTTRVSTGGRIRGGSETGFRLRLAVADGTARTGLAFPAVQRYSDGKVVRWIGGPASDTPAGVLEAALPAIATAPVTPTAPTTTSTATTTAPTTTTTATTSRKGGGNPAGVIFALVGAAIAIGGVVAIIRARRTKDPPVSRGWARERAR